MPVRDALRLLETEQLVSMAPHRGARVSELSADEIALSVKYGTRMRTRKGSQ